MFQILVVEDDKELNQAVCSYLCQNGYDPTGCLNASDAYDTMYTCLLYTSVDTGNLSLPRKHCSMG